VEPTAPPPDFVVVLGSIVVHNGGWVCAVQIKPTGPHDVTLVMDDLHRHTRRELERYVRPLGFEVSALRWDDVVVTSRDPVRLTAMASLSPRDDPEWASIRQAILEDEHDRRTLESRRQLEASLHRAERRSRRGRRR
jgi:hypothetical protein